MTLKAKGVNSLCDVINSYGSDKRAAMITACEQIFNEDACKDLPTELEKKGIKSTVEQCSKQSAEIVGRYANELKREYFKIAREVSGGHDPKIALLNLDDVDVELIHNMVYELELKFGRHSDRYHDALSRFERMLMRDFPSDVIPRFLDSHNERLNSLLEDKRLSVWRAIFKNNNWSEADVLSMLESGLPDATYDALRRTNGDLDRAVKIVLIAVYEDFFINSLGGQLRAAAIRCLEPNESLEILLCTVDDVVIDAYDQLEDRIAQRVNDIAESMLEDCREDFMSY